MPVSNSARLPTRFWSDRINNAKFMKGVLSGNPHDLVQHIFAASHPDISISYDLTHLLHVDYTLTRSHTGAMRADAYNNAMAAKGTIHVILAQCTAVTSNDAPTNDIAGLLKAEYLPLLRWSCLLLDNWVEHFAPSQPRGFSIAVAHLLRIMLDAEMDEELASMVLSSPQVIELGFKLWGDKFDGDSYTTGPGKGCVVAELWKAIFRHDVGRDSFLVHIHTSPRCAKEFAATFRNRLRALEGSHHSRVNVTYAISRIRDLIHLANHILQPSTAFPSHFLLRLHSPETVFDLTRTLSIVIHHSAGEFPVEETLDIFSFILDITFGDRGLSVNPVKKIQAALNGGLYSLLCNIMCQLPSTGDDYQTMLVFLLDIAIYAVYPQIVSLLAHAVDRVYLGPCPFLDARSRTHWQLVARWMHERQAMSSATSGLYATMCHCIHHHNNHGKEAMKAKWCSKCRTVAYCSPACQKVDWHAGHRHECSQIARNRFLVSPAVPSYLQVGLAAFVQDFFSYDNRFSRMVGLFPFVPPSSRITIIDARQLPIKVKLLPLGDFDKGKSCAANGIIRGYLTARTEHAEVELVDSWFPWGRYAINLLVRLRKVTDDDFRTLGAVTLGVWEIDGVTPIESDGLIFLPL